MIVLAWTALVALSQAEVIRTVETECAPWAKIEVLQDKKTRFPEEKYLPHTRHQEFKIYGGGVLKAFESPTPPPSLSLLHFAAEPKEARHETPVLLVHGAGADATLAFHAKNIGGEAGLAPFFVEQGYRVFGVTFAVPHGDNLSHAVHVAHAVDRVLSLTGAKRVDIIAHSMGGLAVRAYLVGLEGRIPKYKGGVRRVVLVSVPNEGCDITFRHPVAHLWFKVYGFPSPWLRKDGKDVTAESIYGGAFMGHLQMVADLRNVHPLLEREEHVLDTYVGNKFGDSHGPGLRAAERQGGDFIRKLNGRPPPAGVELFLVAGNDNNLRYYDKAGQVKSQIGEYDGPSDGLVFVKSVLSPKLAGVKERLEVHMPHFELTYVDEVKKAVDEWLGRP